MAYWLRALAAPAENPDIMLSPHIGVSHVCISQAPSGFQWLEWIHNNQREMWRNKKKKIKTAVQKTH